MCEPLFISSAVPDELFCVPHAYRTDDPATPADEQWLLSHSAAHTVNALPSARIWHTIKWVAAALGVALYFFFALTLGSVISYLIDLLISASPPASSFLSSVFSLEDSLIRASIVGQLVALVVCLPIWLAQRKQSILRARAQNVSSRVWAYLGAGLAGVGLQLFMAYVVSFVLRYLPELQAEYTELMTGLESGTFLASLLTVAILAPLVEELVFRGCILECFLRAFSLPRASTFCSPQNPPRSFAPVCAIVFQALLFGLMHLNIVQSTYAFFMGLAFGWVTWKSGRIRYSMILHLAINFSAFFVGLLELIFASVAWWLCIVLGAMLSAGGLFLFACGIKDASQSAQDSLFEVQGDCI